MLLVKTPNVENRMHIDDFTNARILMYNTGIIKKEETTDACYSRDDRKVTDSDSGAYRKTQYGTGTGANPA